MNQSEMRIAAAEASRVADEEAILNELLPLKHATVLELGCGKADKTRLVARQAASVFALEVDRIQLANNQAAENPDNVRFEFGGAENIPAADSSFDIVLMFKSLHHIRHDLIDDAFSELSRVSHTFFLQPMHFDDFSQFENRILKVTHTDHSLSPALHDAVRAKFDRHMTAGGVNFHMPIRVDLFRKISS